MKDKQRAPAAKDKVAPAVLPTTTADDKAASVSTIGSAAIAAALLFANRR